MYEREVYRKQSSQGHAWPIATVNSVGPSFASEKIMLKLVKSGTSLKGREFEGFAVHVFLERNHNY